MNFAQALKAIAPAVGDGKIVPMTAYVQGLSGSLIATNNFLSVKVAHDAVLPDFCVRYDALMRAVDREGIILTAHAESNGVVARAGRSRVTLKGVDPDTFPGMRSFESDSLFLPLASFTDTLEGLSSFTAGGDGHIWQMGVHFRGDFAFAFSPFEAAFCETPESPADLSVPPWAAKFLLAQEEAPTSVSIGRNTFAVGWPDIQMVSTYLIEGPPDGAHSFIENLPRSGGVPVPPGFKETIERIKSYGVKRIRLGEGRITHVDDRIEIEEEIDIDVRPRIWGVDQMLNALKFAETIDLSGDRAIWHGSSYHGVFSGVTG